MTKELQIVGWREWASLPQLGIPALKAKIDTGARTSALHAFNVETFLNDERLFVRFSVHPIRRRPKIQISCEAEVVDQRMVRDSGGHQEKRHVIVSPVTMGGETWDIELTLTNRDDMLFPMLLGRSAMKGRLLVDVDQSYVLGRGFGRVYRASSMHRRDV